MVRSPPRRSPRSRVERPHGNRPRSPRPRSPVRGKGAARRRPSPRRPGGPRHGGRSRSPFPQRPKPRGNRKNKNRNRRGNKPPQLSDTNSMPVASMRMRMDDYPSSGRRLLPRIDNKKDEVGPNQTMARARREATTRTKDTFWTKKLLDAEDTQPNRWMHTGFKELYREELGYSDKGESPGRDKSPRTAKNGDARPRKGSPKDGKGSLPKDPRSSSQPKDPRLHKEAKGRTRSRSHSNRRRSRSRSPLRKSRPRRRRSFSGSYSSSSSRSSSGSSYTSYSSYSRSSSTGSSYSSYTSSSSSRSRGPSYSPAPRRTKRPPPLPSPRSPPVGKVHVKHKETTKKLVTKTTVTRSVRTPPNQPMPKKPRLKKEGVKKSHRPLAIEPDQSRFYEEPPVVAVASENLSYSPASPRPIPGHLLDPHHYQVVPPNHPEYHRVTLRDSDEDDSQSSGSSDDENPRKLTLSERFGKLAQLSSQRQEYDGVRMRIVREGGQDKKVYLEDGRVSPLSAGSPHPHRRGAHEQWMEEHQAEYREYRRRYGEFRNWDPHRDLPRELPQDWDDIHVRHRYYKESGYFGDRSISLEDYLKWEDWWYQYRDWLEKYGGNTYEEPRVQSGRWPRDGERKRRQRY